MYSHFPKKANIPVILLPLNIVFHTVFVDVSNIAVLQLTITFTCMVSFGDSKHETVKPLQSLLEVTPSKLALSAKCTIHDVVFSCFIKIMSFVSFLFWDLF
jgi:hypothetical protein